jgi:hypothetical protein
LNRENALQDIENKRIRLLIQGGISPSANSELDNKFEKKYCLRYYDFGCTYIGYECMPDYNKTVFDYLTKRYGRKWKKKVRKDVIGIE